MTDILEKTALNLKNLLFRRWFQLNHASTTELQMMHRITSGITSIFTLHLPKNNWSNLANKWFSSQPNMDYFVNASSMTTSVDEILIRWQLLAIKGLRVSATSFTFLNIICLCVRKYLDCRVNLKILNGPGEALYISCL